MTVSSISPIFIQDPVGTTANTGWFRETFSATSSFLATARSAVTNTQYCVGEAHKQTILEKLRAAISEGRDPCATVVDQNGFVFGAACIQVNGEIYDVLKDQASLPQNLAAATISHIASYGFRGGSMNLRERIIIFGVTETFTEKQALANRVGSIAGKKLAELVSTQRNVNAVIRGTLLNEGTTASAKEIRIGRITYSLPQATIAAQAALLAPGSKDVQILKIRHSKGGQEGEWTIPAPRFSVTGDPAPVAPLIAPPIDHPVVSTWAKWGLYRFPRTVKSVATWAITILTCGLAYLALRGAAEINDRFYGKQRVSALK